MRAAPNTTPCDCGHDATPEGCSMGYGIDRDDKTVCFACCAVRDRADMIATGRATLYLTGHVDPALVRAFRGHGSMTRTGQEVTNWPGTLRIPVLSVKFGRHNIARTRTDVWFRFEGADWHGVNYGENTQLIHCKRTK